MKEEGRWGWGAETAKSSMYYILQSWKKDLSYVMIKVCLVFKLSPEGFAIFLKEELCPNERGGKVEGGVGGGGGGGGGWGETVKSSMYYILQSWKKDLSNVMIKECLLFKLSPEGFAIFLKEELCPNERGGEAGGGGGGGGETVKSSMYYILQSWKKDLPNVMIKECLLFKLSPEGFAIFLKKELCPNERGGEVGGGGGGGETAKSSM